MSLNLQEASESFDVGAYERVVQLSSAIPNDSAELEAGLYLQTASYCLLGQYQRSLRVAKRYLSGYPKGKYLLDVSYYYAVSLGRLGYHEAASEILTKIIAAEASEYLYLARYELALLEFNSAQHLLAEKRLHVLLERKLEPKLEVQARLLVGRNSEAIRIRGKAEEEYLAAIELAQKNGLKDLEAEALFYVISFYGRKRIAGEPNETMERALPYYDLYMQNYADSAYTAQVLAAAMPALEKVGRSQEGVKQLEKVLVKSIDAGEEAGVRDAARAYLWARVDAGEKLHDVRGELMAGMEDARTAVLSVALAGIYERAAQRAYLSWGRGMKFRALARSLRASLIEGYEGVKLPSYIELEKADFLSKSRAESEWAEAFYREAMQSEIADTKVRAQLGLARLWAQHGGDKTTRSVALLEDLEKRVQGDRELLDITLLSKIQAYDLLGRWSNLQQESGAYLDDKERLLERAKVLYCLAKSYDQQGKVEDAIANYTQIFTNHTGNLEISAPAVERLTQLTWERNLPAKGDQMADRQIAYQLAHRYLTLTEEAAGWKKRLAEVAPHLASIRQNVTLWEQSGEVETVELMLEQMRKGERPVVR